MTTNIVTAAFGAFKVTRTRQLYQYDYGQILRFAGIELPDAYTVHFSNRQIGGDAVKQVGGAEGVQIPDEMLTSGQNVYAWVFLHTGEDDGETMYAVTIPVQQRPKPTEEEPTPVQQGLIEQAIAALSAAVEQTGEDVEAAAQSAEAAQAAQEAAEAAQSAAETASGTATGAASAAAESARQAAQSASNAALSASGAAGSAAAAAGSATDAGNSASNAEGSASDAAQSKTDAAGSAQNAHASADAAAGYASAASGSATSAANSASAAATSETNAANSANAAARSANDASGSASAAAGSAAGAADSATAAAGSAAEAKAFAHAVSYEQQTLTDGQKTQARANIGAGSEADVDELKSALEDSDTIALLHMDEINNTVQSIVFDGSGNVSAITHVRDNVTIREDEFTFGNGTITEVRTLNTGETLTIVTNTNTLQTTITYAAA